MLILIDNGRMRSDKSGLGQVAVQFTRALIRANPTDLLFQFLTHPAFANFASVAAEIGAEHIKGQFSLLSKLRRIVNKDIFPYYYHGKEHAVRHAVHRQHLTIPALDKNPFVLTLHDMYFLQGNKRSIDRAMRRIKNSINRADVVAFISKHAYDLTAEYFDFSGKQTAIIYNGTDKPTNPIRPAWFKDEMRPFLFSVAQIAKSKNYHIMPPPLPVIASPTKTDLDIAEKLWGNSAPRILTIARLSPRKGIDRTILAVAANSNIKYIVAGDGVQRRELEELAQHNNVNIKFAGAVDEQLKAALYATADVFILPARAEKNDMEGFGIVYLEAAWFGLPFGRQKWRCA